MMTTKRTFYPLIVSSPAIQTDGAPHQQDHDIDTSIDGTSDSTSIGNNRSALQNPQLAHDDSSATASSLGDIGSAGKLLYVQKTILFFDLPPSIVISPHAITFNLKPLCLYMYLLCTHRVALPWNLY